MPDRPPAAPDASRDTPEHDDAFWRDMAMQSIAMLKNELALAHRRVSLIRADTLTEVLVMLSYERQKYQRTEVYAPSTNPADDAIATAMTKVKLLAGKYSLASGLGSTPPEAKKDE